MLLYPLPWREGVVMHVYSLREERTKITQLRSLGISRDLGTWVVAKHNR